jgi:hypothetical protein
MLTRIQIKIKTKQDEYNQYQNQCTQDDQDEYNQDMPKRVQSR